MSDHYQDEMLDVFVYETLQNIELLEAVVLASEKAGLYTADLINEVFRIMHTIKGSSAMMQLQHLAALAHSMEDLFFYLRDNNAVEVDFSSLSDLILAGIDFVQSEIQKIQSGLEADGDASDLIQGTRDFLSYIKDEAIASDAEKQDIEAIGEWEHHEGIVAAGELCAYEAVIFFEDGCEMENIRAYGVVSEIQEWAADFYYRPDDISDNDNSAEVIRKSGFTIAVCTTHTMEEMEEFFSQIFFLKDLTLRKMDITEFRQVKANKALPDALEEKTEAEKRSNELPEQESRTTSTPGQSLVSVHVAKLDKLMDLVGEMLIAEALVTQNPDMQKLQLPGFKEATRQLHKITKEIQDTVMSVRMVPLQTTFHKMRRIVRDMGKKLDKDVRLILIGEDTEVDRSIIEQISDPLMHLVRNAVDHGLEPTADRIASGKGPTGTVTLEARHAGSHVLILVKDDGKGLHKEKILQRARENKLLAKPVNDLTDREIFSLIFMPGFSTRDAVTEYSGRGVGMDVVASNLKSIGGSVTVDSAAGKGTTFTLKIPLTLAIVEGMHLHVGSCRYTIPVSSIRESLRVTNHKIVTDPNGNEMIVIRGICYPVIRLHEHYAVQTAVTKPADGIFVLVEHDEQPFCFFADDMSGRQEVVIKALPDYIRKNHKVTGLGGCALLGDGSISLILDINGFVTH